MSPRAHRAPARALTPLLVLALGGVLGQPAQAQLFGDDEARKAIIELRERVENNRRQAEAGLQRLSAEFARLSEESAAPTRRALLDLGNRIEALKQDLARLNGQSEQLARDVADMQRQQRDVLAAFEERLRRLEPQRVAVDGQDFAVLPEERATYEQAMEAFRKSQFDAAAAGFERLLRQYPNSGYAASAWYWQGNAHYAAGRYKEALDAYRRLLALAPEHPRVPDARLAMANAQLELKDPKAARRTLEELIKASPQSEAAATAKDRLSRLR